VRTCVKNLIAWLLETIAAGAHLTNLTVDGSACLVLVEQSLDSTTILTVDSALSDAKRITCMSVRIPLTVGISKHVTCAHSWS